MAEQNKKDYTPQINTDGVSFYNSTESAEMKSVLTVGFWNGFVNLRLNPALESASEGKTFDYEKSISTAVSVEKLGSLLDGINTSVIPAVGTDASISVAVQVGADGLLSVGVKNGVPFMGIYKGLDANTKIANSYLTYTFKAASTIDNYNPTTGQYALGNGTYSEFKTFCLYLAEALKALSKAYVHAYKDDRKWVENTQYKLQTSMAEKLGIEVKTAGRSTYRKATAIDFSAGANANSTPVETEEIGSLEDIENLI